MLSTVYGIPSQTFQLSWCHHETHDFSSDLTVSKPHFSQSVVPDLLSHTIGGRFNPFWKGWIVTICHLKSRMKPWKYRIATPLPDEYHLAIGQGLCFEQKKKKMLLHCACGGWTCPLGGDAIDHTHIYGRIQLQVERSAHYVDQLYLILWHCPQGAPFLIWPIKIHTCIRMLNGCAQGIHCEYLHLVCDHMNSHTIWE